VGCKFVNNVIIGDTGTEMVVTPDVYYLEEGATITQSCLAGTFLNISATKTGSCEVCVPGRYISDDGIFSDCNRCATGKYGVASEPTNTGSHCSKCPEGYYQNNAGAVACTPCRAG
jgi:hypothetical protein